MSHDSDQTNRSTSRQNNQKPRMNAEGKLQKKLNLETCHNFQRRFRGQMTTPGTAMWVMQRLAEARIEQ